MIDKSAIEILKLYDQRSKLSIKDISLITDTSIEFNSEIVIWLYENNLIETNTLLYDLEKRHFVIGPISYNSRWQKPIV